MSFGELYAGADQREKARENLTKAQAMFQEIGMDYWLARTKKLSEYLETKITDGSPSLFAPVVVSSSWTLTMH